jgi:predicted RNA-binding Zn-ribbon protein involved in translation (DUF1610 family)
MLSYRTLKEAWDEYRLLRQFLSFGEILEKTAANKIISCPRCKSRLEWKEDYLIFYCPGKKCNYREGSNREKDIKEYYIHPYKHTYWLETINPPKWFYYEI